MKSPGELSGIMRPASPVIGARGSAGASAGLSTECIEEGYRLAARGCSENSARKEDFNASDADDKVQARVPQAIASSGAS